jgi:hypothetical protein
MSSSAAELQLRRAAEAAAAVSAAAVLSPEVDEAVCHFQFNCKRITQSVKLVATLESSEQPVQKLRAAAKLLLEDETRDGSSLIDLDFHVEGKGSLLMLLMKTVALTAPRDPDLVVRAKEEELDREALNASKPALPFLCARIRASYDTSSKGPNGMDALTLLTHLIVPYKEDNWSYRVAEALLDRGADVSARFEGGSTPLIQWSLGNKPPIHPGCAPGPLLLLSRGADIDARDDDGTTPAHAIAMKGNAPLAAALADAGWLTVADLTVLNNKSQTALQVAQEQLQANPGNLDRRVVQDLLGQHAALWKEQARPLIHRCLSQAWLLSDLADIVLSFVDGQERGQ